MKNLMKSEICGSVNNARDPHVTENWLKSQKFQFKQQQKKRQKRKHMFGKHV